eukprot:TRINITY_DN50922_c0_g1_i1.p1 TRINITY_DN50922_c0_g1~~TRINITY_DN50922_c0_g1_i1.p1  ORF type:complete len:173 (+),score=23.16 TRINITY_DN50922_c0_g1_i1:228-746(+)
MRILPKLGDLDLRPYLFVSRDQKASPFLVSAAGALSDVAQQLMNGKLVVAGMEATIRRLTIQEAQTVFDLVKTAVLAEADMTSMPVGVYGLRLLARVQTNLQMQILDILEGLDPGKIGAWVVTGWADVFTVPTAQQRHRRMIEEWGQQTSNPALETAAKSAQKPLKHGRRAS